MPASCIWFIAFQSLAGVAVAAAPVADSVVVDADAAIPGMASIVAAGVAALAIDRSGRAGRVARHIRRVRRVLQSTRLIAAGDQHTQAACAHRARQEPPP